jgi:hypothetical protein
MQLVLANAFGSTAHNSETKNLPGRGDPAHCTGWRKTKFNMPIDDMEMCACGKPLHYLDRSKRVIVEEMIGRLGKETPVSVEGRTWMVPRHFIALHGLIAEELPELAKKYGFKETTQPPKA